MGPGDTKMVNSVISEASASVGLYMYNDYVMVEIVHVVREH